MDMTDMVRDMRNRFIIALLFTIPIFIYSPMGGMFTPPVPAFGLSLDLWLFVLASVAIIYPVWPFVVASARALRNGVLNMAALVVLSVGTGYLFSVGSTLAGPRGRNQGQWWCGGAWWTKPIMGQMQGSGRRTSGAGGVHLRAECGRMAL